MKIIAAATAALAILCGCQIQGRAQVVYNSVDLNPSIQATSDAYVNTHRAGGRYGRAAAEADEIERIGALKIKAGKTTVQFVPSVAATQTVAKAIVWEADEPQNLPGQVLHIQRYVNMFNKLAVQNGFKPNDFADGYTFAFALSYAAYNNKDMDKAKVQQLRGERRNFWLRDNYFQGVNDSRKQFYYESNLIMAMQAVEFRAKYRRATSDAERKEYDAKAKEYAEALLGKQ